MSGSGSSATNTIVSILSGGKGQIEEARQAAYTGHELADQRANSLRAAELYNVANMMIQVKARFAELMSALDTVGGHVDGATTNIGLIGNDTSVPDAVKHLNTGRASTEEALGLINGTVYGALDELERGITTALRDSPSRGELDAVMATLNATSAAARAALKEGATATDARIAKVNSGR